MLISLSIFFISFLTFDCLLEIKDPKEKIITLNYVVFKEVGIKGTIIAEVDDGFNSTSTALIFNGQISKVQNRSEYVRVGCGFYGVWNPKKYYVFCKVDNKIPSGNYILDFINLPRFIYKNSSIGFKNISEENLQFSKVDKNITDLYSGTQNIIIDEITNYYELKFSYVAYNKEELYFNKYMFLKNCDKGSNSITCLVNQNVLLEYLPPNQNSFTISYYNNQSCTINEFPLNSINITNNIRYKEDIFVNVENLLTNDIDGKGVIAYKTNVTNISNYYLIDKGFMLTFLKIKNNTIDGEIQFECHFLKYDETPLILLCYASEEGTFRLKEIKETIISDASIKYNYIIKNVANSPVNYYKKTGAFIHWYYPRELDFEAKGNWIVIDFYVDNSADLNGLTFNETFGDLKCENIKNNIKRCNITKDYFPDERFGYYYIHRKNHLDKKIISYEVPPIKVIIMPPNGEMVIYSMIYSAIIFVIVLLLIVI